MIALLERGKAKAPLVGALVLGKALPFVCAMPPLAHASTWKRPNT